MKIPCGHNGSVSEKKLKALLNSLGHNVKARREKLDLVQDDMLVPYDWDIRFYQRIESGKKSISLSTLVRLAEELDCEPYELLKPVKKN